MSDTVVRIRGLRKEFHAGGESIVLFDALDADFDSGAVTVLTGESGSGKSTLLHLIAGIDRPTAGLVEVAGTPVSSLPEKRMNSFRSTVIGLVFQFHYLLKDFTAEENVMLPAYMAGVPRRRALEMARDLLREVGLGGRLRHLPSQLSGGERQRTAVARALINQPSIVLADEPTGNLDAANSRHVEALLVDVVRRRQAALLFVTHDPEQARRADVHYRLRAGGLERQ